MQKEAAHYPRSGPPLASAITIFLGYNLDNHPPKGLIARLYPVPNSYIHTSRPSAKTTTSVCVECKRSPKITLVSRNKNSSILKFRVIHIFLTLLKPNVVIKIALKPTNDKGERIKLNK
jgi:hypothetical protein